MDIILDDQISYIDYIIVYISIVIVAILSLVLSYIGSNTDWYQNLTKSPTDLWIIRMFWILATISLFISLMFLIHNYNSRLVPCFVLISMLLLLGWITIFYYVQNIGLSLWLSLILLTYNFWLFIYVWSIDVLSAIFIIPTIIMYLYLTYSMTHLSYINNIPL